MTGSWVSGMAQRPSVEVVALPTRNTCTPHDSPWVSPTFSPRSSGLTAQAGRSPVAAGFVSGAGASVCAFGFSGAAGAAWLHPVSKRAGRIADVDAAFSALITALLSNLLQDAGGRLASSVTATVRHSETGAEDRDDACSETDNGDSREADPRPDASASRAAQDCQHDRDHQHDPERQHEQ